VQGGALVVDHTTLDMAPLISLRFPIYFAMRFWCGAEPLKGRHSQYASCCASVRIRNSGTPCGASWGQNS
jgi:hypothetical protein